MFPNHHELLAHLQVEHLQPVPVSSGPTHDFPHYYSEMAANEASNYRVRQQQQDQITLNNYYAEDQVNKAFSCLWDDCGLDIPMNGQCTDHFQHHEEHPCPEADLLLSHLLTSHFGLHQPHQPQFQAQGASIVLGW